jgi:hypothetical protein
MAAACTPTLKKPDMGFAYQPEEKADTLRQPFFPQPRRAGLSDINGYEYPPAIKCPEITLQEIERAVCRAAPNRAPGDDNSISCHGPALEYRTRYGERPPHHWMRAAQQALVCGRTEPMGKKRCGLSCCTRYNLREELT